MATLQQGDRIGRLARISFACSAQIFDRTGEQVLLTRRRDNGRWCLPGGRMEPGESAAEACVREVWEETGLQVEIVRLIGLYSSPHWLIEYADGNRRQIVAAHFLVRVVGGELSLSDETSEFGYFSHDELSALDLMETHTNRIHDGFTDQAHAFIR